MGLRLQPEELDAQRLTNQYGLSRKHIFDSVKASLERLQLDYIDVLQCHRWDKYTPIEETMQALHDVVKAGYVRYVGMSSCTATQCAFPFHLHSNSHLYALMIFNSPHHAELRYNQQAYSVHLHAKPLQCGLQRRRARNVPNAQGIYLLNPKPVCR